MQTIINLKMFKSKDYYFSLLIILAVILSYFRIFFLNQIFWDDFHYLQSVYTSSNIADFLKNSGFIELRRIPQGLFLYLVFSLFKISNQAYFILHLIAIAVQIITPVLLYLLIKRLFKNNLAAFIIASSLIILPIDATVPVFTIFIYRFGLMFTVISFYLTQRAFAGKFRWPYLISALLLSLGSNYFFVESAIALEPARLFMIGLILYQKGYKIKEAISKSLGYWVWFGLICAPNILYKILHRPYGIHQGFYTADPLFFLKWKLHLKYLIMLYFGNWVYFLQGIEYLSFWSVIMGLFGTLTAYLLLKRRYTLNFGSRELDSLSVLPYRAGKADETNINLIILFGLLLLLPAVLMYEMFADAPLGVGYDTRHGCIMQFGNALVFGALICAVIKKSCVAFRHRNQFIAIFIAVLLGLGVFFNNLNLDRYFAFWRQQQQFYNAFIERFPALPEKSTFIFDIQDKIPLKYHWYAFYNAEYYVNMLYAKSKDPREFREYKIAEWGFLNEHYKIAPNKYEILSYWGKDIFDTRKFIMVRWQPGELLVNREILAKYPNVAYRDLADKDVPVIPPVPKYPLREKIERFLVL
jgi:hypothetical protein